MDKVTGYVTGVNGNLVAATFSGSVRKNEVGYVLVGDDRLKGEVIRVNGDTASMQIYEMTNGIQVGDKVELSGELMSVELGPGLLTQVFDGLQNPLPELAQQCGFFQIPHCLVQRQFDEEDTKHFLRIRKLTPALPLKYDFCDCLPRTETVVIDAALQSASGQRTVNPAGEIFA